MDDILQLPCLGRPFSIGMLYDCRSEKLIPAVTLWGRQKLNENKTVENRASCKLEVTTNENFEKKTKLLDVDASMKLSLFADMVTLDGSAKYLDDKRSSSSQVSFVSISYLLYRLIASVSKPQ